LILSSGPELVPADFPLATPIGQPASSSLSMEWVNAQPESISLRSLLEEVEKSLITRALQSSGGVQAEAARRLQLSRSDLSYKLSKFGLKVTD
jgi:transcriptional regulator with GAF, ATPase, and Fis domain